MPSPTFADLGVSQAVVRALAARDVHAPFAIQELVIEDVLEGHDVLVKSPTGSGKTLAFGVPMVDVLEPGYGPGALVLAPTRELASQIVDELAGIAKARDLRIAAVYGGVGINPQIKAAGRADILVATPGRLVDLLERNAVTLDDVEILVLDEADRMLDMGFKPVVDKLVALTPDDRQTLLFSATLDGPMADVARRYTSDARRHDQAPAPTETGRIEHRFVRVAHEAKLQRLVDELSEPDRGRTLVFVRTKRGADRLVKRLGRQGIAAAAMHGDRSQAQREKALARFEAGTVDTLVATDVAARGIDVARITHVINFDAPPAAEDYVHRVGRTARAGESGVGITFVLGDQEGDVAKFAGGLGLHAELADAGLAAPADRRGPRDERSARPNRRGRGRRRRP
jgi:ATP-dependent RNA helicase RhlE